MFFRTWQCLQVFSRFAAMPCFAVLSNVCPFSGVWQNWSVFSHIWYRFHVLPRLDSAGYFESSSDWLTGLFTFVATLEISGERGRCKPSEMYYQRLLCLPQVRCFILLLWVVFLLFFVKVSVHALSPFTHRTDLIKFLFTMHLLIMSCLRVYLVMIWTRLRLMLAHRIEGSKWYGNVLGKSLGNAKVI